MLEGRQSQGRDQAKILPIGFGNKNNESLENTGDSLRIDFKDQRTTLGDRAAVEFVLH